MQQWRRSSISALLAAALTLGGCSSSGSGGTAFEPPGRSASPTGGCAGSSTPVALNIQPWDVGNALTALSYETGPHGKWTALSTSATSFSVPCSTKSYGVAWTCSIDGSLQVAVMQATTDDYTTVLVECTPPPPVTISGTIDATAYESSNPGSVLLDGDYVANFVYSYTPTYSAAAIPQNTTGDVVAALYDSTATKLLALKTFPDLTVGTSPVSQNITYAPSDAVNPGQSLTVNGLPSGWEGTAGAAFTSPDLLAIATLTPYTPETTTSPITLSFPTPAPGDANGLYAEGSYADNGSTQNPQSVVSATYIGSATTPQVSLPVPWSVTPPTTPNDPTVTLNYTDFASCNCGAAAVSSKRRTPASQPSGGCDDAYLVAFRDASGDALGAVVTANFLQSTGTMNYQIPLPWGESGEYSVLAFTSAEWTAVATVSSGVSTLLANNPAWAFYVNPFSEAHRIPQERVIASASHALQGSPRFAMGLSAAQTEASFNGFSGGFSGAQGCIGSACNGNGFEADSTRNRRP